MIVLFAQTESILFNFLWVYCIQYIHTIISWQSGSILLHINLYELLLLPRLIERLQSILFEHSSWKTTFLNKLPFFEYKSRLKEGLGAEERAKKLQWLTNSSHYFLNPKDIYLQFNAAGVAVSSSKTGGRELKTIWKKFWKLRGTFLR